MALADAAREAASRARSSLGGHGANVSGAVALASKERASLGDTHVTSVSGLSIPVLQEMKISGSHPARKMGGEITDALRWPEVEADVVGDWATGTEKSGRGLV